MPKTKQIKPADTPSRRKKEKGAAKKSKLLPSPTSAAFAAAILLLARDFCRGKPKTREDKNPKPRIPATRSDKTRLRKTGKEVEPTALENAIPMTRRSRKSSSFRRFSVNLADTEQSPIFARIPNEPGINESEKLVKKSDPLFIARFRNAILRSFSDKKGPMTYLSVE